MTVSVFIVDTSYLTELLKVPGFSDDAASKKIWNRYEKAVKNDSRIFVTLPCIFELANHIAGVNDGNRRRELGNKFFEIIRSCITEDIPWIIIPPCDMEVLTQFSRLCEVFAGEYILQGIGLTDTNIIQESKRLKKKYSTLGYNVYIWTKDENLKAHEPDPEIDPFLG